MALRSDPKNARRHTSRNKEIIRKSLTECGAFRSIGVDGDDVIRAGNGVFEQATAMGMKVRVVEAAPDELIAVRRADLKGKAAEKAALYDNRAGELSEWDAQALVDLEESGMRLDGLWGDDEFQELRDQAAEGGEIETGLDDERDPDKPAGKYLNKDSKKQIKPVLMAEQVETFERAIKATGNRCRAEALMAVCRAYLDE